MKTDIYTKFVLTVIAVCLVILCWQNFRITPQVHAQSVQPVVIVSTQEPLPVGIVGWGAKEGESLGAEGWTFSQGVPVRLASQSEPIRVVSDGKR